jgi:ADP-heptose:LPS heptosyltransferase
VIRCLKQQLGAEIHFLTKKAFTGILESNPYVDRVFGFERDIDEVLPTLKNEQYDHVVDLHHNLRSIRLKFALGRPSSAFNKLNFEKWLLVQTGINRLPAVHIVDRYVETVAQLGVKNDGCGLDYFIPVDQEIKISDLSPHLLPGNYVSFVIGATHATKRLLPTQMVELCNLIRHPVLLLGGKAEAETGTMIKKMSKGLIINACGQLNLNQSASAVKQAGLVLTHDTGLMHIAAAFRKKIVSIWGNTVPAFGMYPYYPVGADDYTTVEIKNLSCRPCSKIGHDHCPKGHFRCMQDLSMSALAADINKWQPTQN